MFQENNAPPELANQDTEMHEMSEDVPHVEQREHQIPNPPQNQAARGYAPSLRPHWGKAGPETRQWLNQEITPVLLEGMRMLVHTKPERPLKVLAEYMLEEDKKRP